jgi:hypothetical protein
MWPQLAVSQGLLHPGSRRGRWRGLWWLWIGQCGVSTVTEMAGEKKPSEFNHRAFKLDLNQLI